MTSHLPQAFTPDALRQPRFGELMSYHRGLRKLTVREAAVEATVSKSTWKRAEDGKDLRVSVQARIVEWILRDDVDGRPGRGVR